jgi:general secretion pathway protein H
MRRISATGIRGFTLVELLVVVAITGIVLAVAAVNLWPNDAEVARREAGYVALSLEKARDAAWFGGRPTAISFNDGRMRFWRLAPNRTWAAEPALDRALGPTSVTGLYVDGVALSPSDRLIFLADGFAQPFRVALEVRGISRGIEGDAAGSLMLTDK